MFPVVMKTAFAGWAEGARQFARSGAELWARFGYTTRTKARSIQPWPTSCARWRMKADSRLTWSTIPMSLVDRDFIRKNVAQEIHEPLPRGSAKTHH